MTRVVAAVYHLDDSGRFLAHDDPESVAEAYFAFFDARAASSPTIRRMVDGLRQRGAARKAA